MKSWIKCDLITPRTIPDDIELFDSGENGLDLVKIDKPWLAYINSHLNKSIVKCL